MISKWEAKLFSHWQMGLSLLLDNESRMKLRGSSLVLRETGVKFTWVTHLRGDWSIGQKTWHGCVLRHCQPKGAETEWQTT